MACGICGAKLATQAVGLDVSNVSAVHRAFRSVASGRLPRQNGRPTALDPAQQSELLDWLLGKVENKQYPSYATIASRGTSIRADGHGVRLHNVAGHQVIHGVIEQSKESIPLLHEISRPLSRTAIATFIEEKK